MIDIAAQYRWRWRPALQRGAYRAAYAVARVLLWPLPGRMRLALRQAAAVVAPLDYRGGGLRLHVESLLEYDKRARSCAKEPETVAWIERNVRPGDVVFDIGANVGAYALVAARFTAGRARVFAFEPGCANFAQLCRNIVLNDCGASVVPLALALSDHTGFDVFHYRSLDSGAALHTLGADAARAVFDQPLPCYRLDDLVERFGLPQPNHIKLDVDGIEHAVLQGAERTLKDPALRTVLVETDDGRSGSERITATLAAAGLRLASTHPHHDNPLHRGPVVRNCVYVREG